LCSLKTGAKYIAKTDYIGLHNTCSDSRSYTAPYIPYDTMECEQVRSL